MISAAFSGEYWAGAGRANQRGVNSPGTAPTGDDVRFPRPPLAAGNEACRSSPNIIFPELVGEIGGEAEPAVSSIRTWLFVTYRKEGIGVDDFPERPAP